MLRLFKSTETQKLLVITSLVITIIAHNYNSYLRRVSVEDVLQDSDVPKSSLNSTSVTRWYRPRAESLTTARAESRVSDDKPLLKVGPREGSRCFFSLWRVARGGSRSKNLPLIRQKYYAGAIHSLNSGKIRTFCFIDS